MFEFIHNLLHLAGLCPEVIGTSMLPEFTSYFRSLYSYIKFKFKVE